MAQAWSSSTESCKSALLYQPGIGTQFFLLNPSFTLTSFSYRTALWSEGQQTVLTFHRPPHWL